MKQPYIQFFVGDWRVDTAVSLCSPSARGIWFDIICHTYQSGCVGELRGSIENLSKMCRCSNQEVESALSEILTNNVADVSWRGKEVSITCRRIRREIVASSKYSIRSFVSNNYERIFKRLCSRHGALCQKCGSFENLQIDHKHPVSKGGNNDFKNLQLLCGRCNRKKHNHIESK